MMQRSGMAARLVRLAARSVFVLAVGAVAAAASGDRVRPVAAPDVLAPDEAAALARRVAMIEAELTAIWRHDLRLRHGRDYVPPQIVTFAGRRFGPCGGAGGVTGMSYCAGDRTLSVDLALLARLEGRLGSGAEAATALLLAHRVAAHVQAELAILGDAERLRHALAPEARDALDRDVALQADCLAGVWAKRAARALGPVAPGGWGALIETLRGFAPEAAVSAGLDGYPVSERDDAFARGYAEGAIRACLTPDLRGVLG